MKFIRKSANLEMMFDALATCGVRFSVADTHAFAFDRSCPNQAKEASNDVAAFSLAASGLKYKL